MSLPAYESYQPAPERWLGALPAHWRIERMKYGLIEKPTKRNGKLPPGAISYGKVVAKDGDRISPETRETYQEVLSGEYLINPINLNYDLISLRTALSEIDVCVSPAYIVLRPVEEKLNPTFGNYLLHVFDVCHMKTLGAGVRQTITFKDIGQCLWPLPPAEEQTAIARFLDRETARIDSLIEKKGRFIELLKEKRAAVITHAVTKGLDPNAPMKDSGEAWIGAIPAHWETKPLRAFFAFRNEKNDPIRTENILSLSIAHGVTPYTEEGRGGNKSKDDLTAYKIAHEGDIVLNSMNVIVGAVGRSKYFGAISPVYYALYPASSNVNVTFFEKIFMNTGFQKGLLRYGKGILMKISGTGQMNTIRMKISQDDLKTVVFPVPPEAEQREIASHIDLETARIDTLIAKTERSIELLREKRSALITAAVTGKIDVRAAA